MSDELTSMNVSLPESMREFVRARMAKKGFANASEYVRQLIRDDLREAEEERIDKLLLEGLHSGPGTPVTPKFWDDLKKRVKARIEEKQRNARTRRAG
ncbi:Antitoxin ParD4 [Phycisphaerales bacterium]|nr:Antitoxin ParD4 [Phycisphaerales bacterium]